MTVTCDIAIDDGCGTDAKLLAVVEAWLAALLRDVAPEADSFAVRLADDEEVRELNARLRGKEGSTDVLSFPGEVSPEGMHLGDVLISLPVARRQAAELGHSLRRELEELIVHGVLHCLGHDHESDGGEMDAMELELRQRWIDHD